MVRIRFKLSSSSRVYESSRQIKTIGLLKNEEMIVLRIESFEEYSAASKIVIQDIPNQWFPLFPINFEILEEIPEEW